MKKLLYGLLVFGWVCSALYCSRKDSKETHLTPQDAKGFSKNRWSKEKANHWYANQDWPVGTNFGPSNAINQLEMWQEETFDLVSIEKELALSASLGMNTHRVFLHNLLWERDSIGFLKKIDQFLEVSAKYNIKPMLVLFDGVWHPVPKLGKQPDPTPHKHNSGWVQGPGAEYLNNPAKYYPRLKAYVLGVMGRFAEDDRILVWDIFNEPENMNPVYSEFELLNKYDRSFELLRAAYGWAREVNPSQPITSAVWGGFMARDGTRPDELTEISKFMLENSDIITFHTYQNPKVVPLQIDFLKSFDRPILCTEYLARSRDNNFENILPLFKKNKIGAYNWGLVSGKTNTIYHWDSWDSTYVAEPELWHHDIFRNDLTPYKVSEVDLIKKLTSE